MELYESAKAGGSVVETSPPAAEQPKPRTSKMDAETMRDTLVKPYKEEEVPCQNPWALENCYADATGLATLSGAELMRLEMDEELSIQV
eukprot:764913-Hanusia_phi.AAC.1